MLRMIAGLTILGCAAAPALAQSISFDEAKQGDEAKKLAFLDQEIGKLVFCKDKNPKGYVKAWYYMPGAAHKDADCRCGKCAQAALQEEYKKDGREKFLEKEIKEILASLESPAQRILPFYRETAQIGNRKRQGILLVGDLFALKSEEELRSTLEDYLAVHVKYREETLALKDGDNEQELNPSIPILRDIAHSSLLNLYARSVQIEKIASKARKVSDEFQQDAVKKYLASHKLYCRQFAKEMKIWDDNNENTLQKEIIDFLGFMKDHIYKNLKKAGLEHKVIKKEAHEYALEGI